MRRLLNWWLDREPSEREVRRFFRLAARDPYFGREYSRPKEASCQT